MTSDCCSATTSRPTGEPDGNYVIAVDTVAGGPGETVLILDEGTSARQILEVPGGPVRALIVGVIDETQLG